MPFQQGLLANPVPAHARHLFFTLQSPEALPAALDALLPQVDGEQLLLGVGAPLAKALGREVPGLRAFPLLDAALLAGGQPGLAGSSFAAFQLWKHDLEYFKSLPQADQDNIIGRRLSDNEELDDAPASAHVKRTAQESFEPEAFMVRRSVAWADQRGAGLAFVALGHSFDAFEVQLRRMSGLEDGIIDGLYRFSRPLTGGYYWCPPMGDAGVDLGQLLQA